MIKNYKEYIEGNIVKCDVSYRGGSLVVDVSGLLSDESNEAIYEAGERTTAGAYQNYLGGGIAGSIQAGRNFDVSLLTQEDQKEWSTIEEALKRFFYDVNEGGGDEYMHDNVTGPKAGGYEEVQKLPASGY